MAELTVADCLAAIAALDANPIPARDRKFIQPLDCGHVAMISEDRGPVILTDDGEAPLEDCCRAALAAKFGTGSTTLRLQSGGG